MTDPDIVVIGAGPNGLTAAILAARAGWDVLVLEGSDRPGGAVRSDELTLPGVVHDTFSAFHPMALSSPALRSFDLEGAGLVWCQAPLHNAHLAADGRTAIIHRDLDVTAERLDTLAPGDGDAWRRYIAFFDRIEAALLDNLYSPIPNPGALLRLGWRVRRDPWDAGRFMLASVRTMTEDRFAGEPARRMLCALALHSDVPPESPTGAVSATMLAGSAQLHGWPTPQGGAGRLADALVRRLEEAGGRVVCDTTVRRIEVRNGRATGVVTTGGDSIGVRRAVLADVGAPALLLGLLGEDYLPAKIVDRLQRFRQGAGTFKVDWALHEGVPWTDPDARRAGTVHIGDDVDDMSRYVNEFVRGLIPDRPYVLLGQQSIVDPTRAPDGMATLWGYTHVPFVPRGDAAGELVPEWDVSAKGFADRIEDRIEELAPGFRDRILARHVMAPGALEERNPNLVGGDIAGGSFDLTQQLVFRPLPGLWRYRMPVRGVYLCSASAHPGGGVHGGPGAAAWQVLRSDLRLHRA